MRSRTCAFVAACVVLTGVSAGSTPSSAQDAAPPTPAPPAASTPLPPVTVETSAQPPKKSAAKKKAKSTQAPVAAAPTPQPQAPSAPPIARGETGSGTGPLDGYVAGQTTTGTKTDTPLREVPQSVSVVGK
jgi:iron complex outermembrane receptor protein